MKLTKQQLKKIIKEELEAVLEETEQLDEEEELEEAHKVPPTATVGGNPDDLPWHELTTAQQQERRLKKAQDQADKKAWGKERARRDYARTQQKGGKIGNVGAGKLRKWEE
tara:strand:+ start:2466 stop:2798 length:333 start_codon:yes stop_codon:yes gene_type:complete